MDSAGRIFVADRANNCIQIFDQNGKLLDTWNQFGRPSAVYIRNDIIYVSDSQSNYKTNPPFQQGIRIGSVKDGNVKAFIPAFDRKTAMPEGLAVDKHGNVFGGFAAGMDFKKFAKKLTPSWLRRSRVIRIAGFAHRPAFRIRIRTAAAPASEKSQ